MSDADLTAARLELLADLNRHKADWYRARKTGLVVGPLERHHDRWHWLFERDAWAPSGAREMPERQA